MDFSPSWAQRHGLLRARSCEPRGIILHTTGAGPWRRWEREQDRFSLPFDAARYVYESFMKYSPHYLVCGETGQAIQLNDLSLCALHVGSKGSRKYRSTGWSRGKNFAWWFRRFDGLRSPRDLFGGALWTMGSANQLGVGIEVSPPMAGPRVRWSHRGWKTLRDLVGYLTSMLGVPRDREHVISHSDAHPLARSTESGRPWDPGYSQWRTESAVDRLELL